MYMGKEGACAADVKIRKQNAKQGAKKNCFDGRGREMIRVFNTQFFTISSVAETLLSYLLEAFQFSATLADVILLLVYCT